MTYVATQLERGGRRIQVIYVTLAAAVLIGLLFSPLGDQGFFAIALLGPLLTGVLARVLGWSWRLGAAPWLLTGAFMLVYDGVINSEDVAFHVVVTVLMVALVVLGTLIGRLLAGAPTTKEKPPIGKPQPRDVRGRG